MTRLNALSACSSSSSTSSSARPSAVRASIAAGGSQDATGAVSGMHTPVTFGSAMLTSVTFGSGGLAFASAPAASAIVRASTTSAEHSVRRAFAFAWSSAPIEKPLRSVGASLISEPS